MASKKALLMAYEVIAANAPLIRADSDHAYKIMIHSWNMALADIDDKSLAIGVERFLKEVTEVNRSMVISAKLRELCLPQKAPFNEYIVTRTINQIIQAGRDIEALKALKAETEPLLWEVIMDYPYEAIQTASLEQLPTIYAQVRNDYRLRHMKQQAEKHNETLRLMVKNHNNRLMEMK